MRRFFTYLTCTGIIGSVLLSSLFFWLYFEFKKAGPLRQSQTILINRGMTADSISKKLASQSIIDDRLVFKVGLRVFADSKSLKAGEYKIPAKSSPSEVIRILQSGKQLFRSITVAEGLTSSQVHSLIAGVEELTGVIQKIPEEGTLLPETYYFTYGENRMALLDRMKKSMRKLSKKLWVDRAANLPLASIKDAIILASIVEKETAKSGERPHVASVFINRLRIKMRLQSDPTVIYGITLGKEPLGRRLTRSDLRRESPFNTYLIEGLPPSPIANPGSKAIEAVLHPKKSNDLYFVADGKGGHVFAKTLKEHNRNASNWRNMRDKN